MKNDVVFSFDVSVLKSIDYMGCTVVKKRLKLTRVDISFYTMMHLHCLCM